MAYFSDSQSGRHGFDDRYVTMTVCRIPDFDGNLEWSTGTIAAVHESSVHAHRRNRAESNVRNTRVRQLLITCAVDEKSIGHGFLHFDGHGVSEMPDSLVFGPFTNELLEGSEPAQAASPFDPIASHRSAAGVPSTSSSAAIRPLPGVISAIRRVAGRVRRSRLPTALL